MNARNQHATTAKALPAEERKNRLERVARGAGIKASLVDLREPSKQARELGKRLEGKAAQALARNGKAAA